MSITESHQVGLDAVRTMFQNRQERAFLSGQLLENAKKSHDFAGGHMNASIKGSEITIMPTTDFAFEFLKFQCQGHPDLFEQNKDGSVTVSVEKPEDRWDFLSALQENYASNLQQFLSSQRQGLG